MPLLETKGVASAQGFGLTLQQAAPVYVEDVFSTTLYSGTGSFRAVDVGLSELAVTGGLCWFKGRTSDIFTENHKWYDTARATGGAGGTLVCNPAIGSDQASIDNSGSSTTFYPTGTAITLNGGTPNNSNVNYVAWTFRKKPKFFDVVTYTGNGSNRTIAHSLGAVPGCIIVKRTSGSESWFVYHRSTGATKFLMLNYADDAYTQSDIWNNTEPTASVFSLGTNSAVNANGSSYVAYLFAHNAGGFGLTGTDNVISCGTVTGSQVVNLGYEPQWVLSKCSGSAGQDWTIVDNMRGAPIPASGNTPYSTNLMPNLSNTESTSGTNGASVIFNSTGFRLNPDTVVATTYIYIAIRRGPMKTPTTGTSVYEAYYSTTSIANQTNGSLPSVDFTMQTQAPTPLGGYNWTVFDRLRGTNRYILTDSTAAQATDTSVSFNAGQLGVRNSTWFSSGGVGYNFKRAPGFMDVVCYTGNGTGSRALSHNLGVAPEMVIVKQRTAVGGARSWWVLTTSGPRLNILNDNSAANAFGVPANLFGDATYNNYIAPTSTTVTLSPSDEVNNSSNTYVMYLFSTLAGVSKVGSYTGNGSSQTINCGFTTGARFVLIKRTDSTGNWVVFDYARGIVAGNDPYLTLNTTNAQVDTQDAVDTNSTGFVVNETTGPNINTNGAAYIFLAIA